MSYTEWAHKQIAGNSLNRAEMPRMAYEELAKSLVAVCSGSGQLFGMGLGSFDADALPSIRDALASALCEYKSHYEEQMMLSWVFELDGIAQRFGIDQLRLTKRFPLRCDPLGGRVGLAQPWLERLRALDAARAGTTQLALAAVGFDGTPTVQFGDRDDEALYRHAMSFENATRTTFPRELAAWWSTTNGIFSDDVPFLEPVKRWRDDEIGETEGLRIGAGTHEQGSLFLVGVIEKGLDKVTVVETDDEVVIRKYKSFAELVDRLLGR